MLKAKPVQFLLVKVFGASLLGFTLHQWMLHVTFCDRCPKSGLPLQAFAGEEMTCVCASLALHSILKRLYLAEAGLQGSGMECSHVSLFSVAVLEFHRLGNPYKSKRLLA